MFFTDEIDLLKITWTLLVSFKEGLLCLYRITATVDGKLYNFVDKIFSAQDVKSRKNLLDPLIQEIRNLKHMTFLN